MVLAGCMASVRRARVADPDPGERLFAAYCAACHQYDGQAVGEAPPLDGASWVVGPPETLVKIVLHGVRGRMEIAGEIYDREMPGFGAILFRPRSSVAGDVCTPPLRRAERAG